MYFEGLKHHLSATDFKDLYSALFSPLTRNFRILSEIRNYSGNGLSQNLPQEQCILSHVWQNTLATY